VIETDGPQQLASAQLGDAVAGEDEVRLGEHPVQANAPQVRGEPPVGDHKRELKTLAAANRVTVRTLADITSLLRLTARATPTVAAALHDLVTAGMVVRGLLADCPVCRVQHLYALGDARTPPACPGWSAGAGRALRGPVSAFGGGAGSSRPGQQRGVLLWSAAGWPVTARPAREPDLREPAETFGA
jgi:hypothetical protein